MTADGSKSAIREILRYLGVVENWALHYAGGKDDLITCGIVIRLFGCHISHGPWI